MNKMIKRKPFLLGLGIIFFLSVVSVLYHNRWMQQKKACFSGEVRANIVSFCAPHTGKIFLKQELDIGTQVVKGQELFKVVDDVLMAQKEYAAALVAQMQKEKDLKKLCIEEVMQEYIESRRLQKPQEYIDKQVAELQKAQANYEVVQANLLATQKQQNVFEAQIHQQTISSPFDAIICNNDCQQESWVQGGEKVLSIYNPQTLFVYVEVDPKEFSLKPLNAFAKIVLSPKGKEQVYQGRVQKVESFSDKPLLSLHISIDALDSSTIQPGMSAQVHFSSE